MDSTAETRQLESAPVGRLLLRHSLPAICGSLVGATYNIVDRIFVGWRFGHDGIAAVTLSFPVMLILLAIGMMIGVGSNTLISIRLGEKNKEEAERILGQAIFLFAVLSLSFTVFGLTFLDPLLRLFGANEKVLPPARSFLAVIIAGAFFQPFSFGVNSFLRGEGKPRIAMITMLISAFVNIILDWFFLFVLRTDIWGAALATVIAQAAAVAWITWYYLSGKALLKWRLRFIRFDRRLAWTVLSIGFPPFVMQGAACVLQGVQNHQLGHYGNAFGTAHGIEDGGNLAISVMGILFTVFMLFLLPLLGIGQGLQPIAGYNTGAKQYYRVKRALSLACLSGLLFSLVLLLIVQAIPGLFISPFIDPQSPMKPMLMQLGAHAIRIFASLLPCVAVLVIVSGYFQAIGHTVLALILTLTRQVFLLIPFLFLLPPMFGHFGWLPGLDGIWFAHPLSDLATFFLALHLLIREYRRLKKLAAADREPPATRKAQPNEKRVGTV